MTYGEIQYYLYDGDKKEKKVSKDSFMGSKDVAVHHNTPKKKRKTTSSHTGKVIESFEDFFDDNRFYKQNYRYNQKSDWKKKSEKLYNFLEVNFENFYSVEDFYEMTGRVATFENFINEYNGPNLPLNYNTQYDFRTYQGKSFDGGDGPSAESIPEPNKETIKDQKVDRGHKENNDRERKRKHNSKEYRIAKMMDYQTTDDLVKNAPEKQPTVHA